MNSPTQDDHRELHRMAISAIVAVIGATALVLMDFNSANPQNEFDRMTTAAVVSRAHAIATPSEKPVGIEAPETVGISQPGK